jgi:hypothetical protein
MKLNHKAVLVLSAMTWLAIGILLLTKGFALLLKPLESGQSYLLLDWVRSFAGSREQAGLLIICLGLMIGFIKGRMVLSKTAGRIMKRLEALPNPCALSSIYPLSYVILIAGMMCLGISLKWMPIPADLKGLVDVAVGSALTNGSAFYFRYLFLQKKVS